MHWPQSIEGYLPYLLVGIRVVTVFAAGILLTIAIGRLIATFKTHAVRAMVRRGGVLDLEVEKRATTIAAVIRRPAVVLVWGAVVFMVLQELGFHIDALLAGAGVSAGIIGVAIGFGAQSVVKDIIGGLFLLFENQIRVNDVAVINGTGGLVQEINLRTTVLRSENGAVHVFPNGSIQTLSNLTREFSYYVFEITVSFDQNAEAVLDLMREVAAEVRRDALYAPAILEDLDVQGVDRLGTGVTLKARIKTLPQKQWMVGREVNRRLRSRLVEERIEMAGANTVVRFDEPLPGLGREELKAVVREVLQEQRADRQ